MWDLPRPGLEPVCPALAGRFSTTVPPGKPGLVGFYLAPSSVTYFFAISLFFPFFYEWDCVPVLLVVWPEASNTAVCRLLGRAGSWCLDEDLWETSLRWIFPGVWGSLLVQWFGLGAPTKGASAQPLPCEPRSHKPSRVGGKKKRTIIK